MDRSLIFPYAVAVAFGPRPHPRKVVDINAASGAAVDLGGASFLLTAGHVMEKAIERLNEPFAHFIAGDLEVEIDPSRVQLSREIDVATLPLTASEVKKLESDGHHIVRPSAWPPPPLRRGDPVSLVGFPGAWRREIAWDALEFAALTITALIHEVREDEFICQIDPAFLDEYRVQDEDPLPVTLPGLSGGPAFLVHNDPSAVLAPQLCGVVKDGIDFGDRNVVIKYARLDRLDRNGSFDERAARGSAT